MYRSVAIMSIALLSAITSLTAQSFPNVPSFGNHGPDRPRPGGRVSEREILEIKSLIREATDAAERWNFTTVSSKLTAAKLRIQDLRDSRIQRDLVQTLTSLIRLMDDRWALSTQKEREMKSKGEDILRDLDRLRDDDNGGGSARADLRDALDEMEAVVRAVRLDNERDASRSLLRIDDLLREYTRDRDVSVARDLARRLGDKLRDRFLSRREKLDHATSLAREFSDAIERSDLYRGNNGNNGPGGHFPGDPESVVYPRNMGQALQVLEQIQRAAERQRFEWAQRQSAALREYLGSLRYDSQLQKAVDALQRAETKLSESTATEFSKISAIRDGVKVSKNAINQSETYRRERGIDYRGAQTIAFGKTDLFSMKKYETRELTVASPSQPVRALQVFARDDRLAISEVTVILDGGTRLTIGGDLDITENGSVYLDIDLRGKVVSKVLVTATSSAVLFGTKARAEILGVR